MSNENDKYLFRDESGELQEILNEYHGYTFTQNPFDFFIILARYKFAARLSDKNMLVADVGCGHGRGSIMLPNVGCLHMNTNSLRMNLEQNYQLNLTMFSYLA